MVMLLLDVLSQQTDDGGTLFVWIGLLILLIVIFGMAFGGDD
jgi:cytochrome b